MTEQLYTGSDRVSDMEVTEDLCAPAPLQEPATDPGGSEKAERLVAEFLASKGITACPTRYAARVEPSGRTPLRSGY